MTQYNVNGMSCAACSARVERAVSAVEGVTACSVSLLTNSMGVEGNASADVARTYMLLCLRHPEMAEKYLDKYCLKSGTSKMYVQQWLPIVAAAQLIKNKPEERELLMRWIDVVDYS